MGCLFSKTQEAADESPVKEYSWDKRKDIRVEDFILDGLQDRTVVRLPGTVAGQQFIIQNCTNCKIFVLDYSATITVEKCFDCQIITGPIKGSIFLRNCKNCKCLCACQQFRTRDCSKNDIFLFCMTQPIIEASSKMRFGCYQLSYNGLEQQFKDAGLEIMNNTWNSIYDFTPNPEEGPNWNLIKEDSKIEDLFTLATDRSENGDAEESINKNFLPDSMILSTDPKLSITPMTTGDRGRISDESCLVLFFHHDEALACSVNAIRELQQNSINLIKSKQIPLPHDKALEIFDKNTQSSLIKAANLGNVIGLEFNGPNCTKKCESVAAKAVAAGQKVFISKSRQVIEQFYSVHDMQMI